MNQLETPESEGVPSVLEVIERKKLLLIRPSGADLPSDGPS